MHQIQLVNTNEWLSSGKQDYVEYVHNAEIWYQCSNAVQSSCIIVCSMSLMASHIRAVGGLSNCFYEGCDWLFLVLMWLVNLQIDVGLPWSSLIIGWFLLLFLYGFPYRFQRPWTVLWSTKHPLDVVRIGAWNSLVVSHSQSLQRTHCRHVSFSRAGYGVSLSSL